MRSRTSPVTDQQLKEAKRVKREGLEDVTVASAPAVGETSEASSPLSEVSPVSVPDEAEMTEEVAAADMAPEPVVSEDVDRIDPPPSELKLANGQVVLLKRMRTRQFFALLRIISRSAPTMMRSMSLDPSRQSMEEFTTNLIALLVVSIPEADTETWSSCCRWSSPVTSVCPTSRRSRRGVIFACTSRTRSLTTPSTSSRPSSGVKRPT
jgi:hypothetical protein